MKKILVIIIASIFALFTIWYTAAYYSTYSEGVRSGELIKFSYKGVLFKTWEGEISQGLSGANIFKFSVEGKNEEVIKKLEEYQGRYVKLKYKERFATISWLGDSRYFIVEVVEEESPHFRKQDN
ncbi:6-phosphogluconate dehydrogenase [Aquimarina addita]|uniref:6-phosphogluconate dehydrogenase n=1 Tax=Aquimarina addita TaxID=870485 RepID=A0ABP6UPX4_9FLAO